MPIFEYYCPECKTRFEVLCRAAEKTISPPCPQCNNTNTKSIIAGFAIKGSDKLPGSSSCSGCRGSNCSACH